MQWLWGSRSTIIHNRVVIWDVYVHSSLETCYATYYGRSSGIFPIFSADWTYFKIVLSLCNSGLRKYHGVLCCWFLYVRKCPASKTVYGKHWSRATYNVMFTPYNTDCKGTYFSVTSQANYYIITQCSNFFLYYDSKYKMV